MAKDPFDDLEPFVPAQAKDPFDDLDQSVSEPAPTLGLRPAQAESQVTPVGSDLASRGLGLTPQKKIELERRGADLAGATTALETGAAGAATGTLGLAEALYRTPAAAERWARGLSESVETVTGLPRAVNPLRAIESTAAFVARGQVPGTDIQTGGASVIADRIKAGQEFLASEKAPFKSNTEANKRADDAMKLALSGDLSGVADVATDPKAMAGFLGQAAPSLVASYVSGGSLPFIAWMEAMEVAANADEFEQRTGQKISDREFMQAQAQAGIVNSMLERVVPESLLKGEAGKSALNILLTGGKEFATEFTQALNTNLAEILTFNPEKDVTEGALASGLGGFGAGAAAGTAQYAAERARPRGRQPIGGEPAQGAPAAEATQEPAGTHPTRQAPQRAAILREIAKAEGELSRATDDTQIADIENRLSDLYTRLEQPEQEVAQSPERQGVDPFDALVAEQNAARQAEIDAAMPAQDETPRFGPSRMRGEVPQAQAVGARTSPLVEIEPYNVREANRDIAIMKQEKALGDVKVPEGFDDARIKRLPFRQQLQALAETKIKESPADKITPELDEIMTAIAKAGGISIEEARAQGIDPEHFKDRPGQRNPFRVNGKSFDDMAETLSQYGYPSETANTLLDQVSSSLGGTPVHSRLLDSEAVAALESLNVVGGVTPAEAKIAIAKALNGEKLGVRQARVVSTLMDSTPGRGQGAVDGAREQLMKAREERRAIAAGFAPMEAYTDLVDNAGEAYNEEVYEADWDANARSTFELATEAQKIGRGDEAESIVDRLAKEQITDKEAATQLWGLIAEEQDGRQEAVRRDVGEAAQAEETGRVPGEAGEGQEWQEAVQAKPERRIKDKARKLYEAMSKADLIKALLHHELTGIKGKRAFVVELEDAENVIAVDADSLKWVNDNMSPDSGDKLLMITAEALKREFGYDRAYHTSGDEFYVLLQPGDDLAEAKKAMARVEAVVKATTISVERIDGTKITVTGITATPGYGRTKEEADYDLKQEKPRREAEGQRAGRGEQPAGAVITPPEGQQGADVQPATADRTDVRAEDGEEVVASDGKPFKSQKAAEFAANTRKALKGQGYTPVKKGDGWALRKQVKAPTKAEQKEDVKPKSRTDLPPEDTEAMFSRTKQQPRFFSPLQRAIESAPDKVFGKAAQVKLWLQSNSAKLGIKKDELQWSGILDYLDMRKSEKVSKDEVGAFLSENGVQVQDVVKGAGSRRDLAAKRESDGTWSVVTSDGEVLESGLSESRADSVVETYWGGKGDAKFFKYAPPGGIEGSYREILVTLPTKPLEGEPLPLPSDWKTVSRTDSGLFGDGPERIVWDVVDGAGRVVVSGHESEGAALSAANNIRPERARHDVARNPNFRSYHFEEPNILVHLRTDEVTGADGKRYLRVFEIQSDWGQAGKKKGFRDADALNRKHSLEKEFNAIADEIDSKDDSSRSQWRAASEYIDSGSGSPPSESARRLREINEQLKTIKYNNQTPLAPFVTDTRAWVSLGIKRAIMHAINSGVDGVVFATGQQNADLYDLSKQVQSIRYMKVGDKYRVTANKLDNGGTIDLGTNTEAELEDKVGKDVAEKIVNGEGVKSGDMTILRGLDLKIGGSGMRAFYDQIVPSVANEVLKKIGGGMVEQIGDNKGFPITDAMRNKVQTEGLPLFKKPLPGNKITASAESVQQIINSITARLPGSPKVNVIASMADAPADVRELDAQQRSQGAADVDPEGFFNAANGEIYIVLSGVRTRSGETDMQAITRVWAHEVLGHSGLRGLFGKQLIPILREVSLKRRKDVQAKAKQYGLDMTKENDRLAAAEEVLAEIAETMPDNSIVQRAIEAIRKALRALYMRLPKATRDQLDGKAFIQWVNGLTDAEIISRFIVPARQYIERGQMEKAGTMPAAMFQRTQPEHGAPKTIMVDGVERPTTNSNGRQIHPTEEGIKNFWRWFSPSPGQLLDGLSVSEVSSLKRDTEALANFIESQSSLPESYRFAVIPRSVFDHVAGVVNNNKILDAVVKSLPVDVVDFLSSEQGAAKEALHDAAMLENVFSVDPASDVPLGVNPSRIAELAIRLVANAGAKISGMTGRALERNSAALADTNDPVLGAHVRKSPSGNLGIIAGFGDSKVVDDQGRPIVVYHGTASVNIEEFLPSGGASGEWERALDHFRSAAKNNERYGYMNFRSGSFFSPKPDYAGNYTGERGGVMYPVYLKTENPVYSDMSRKNPAHGVDANKTPDGLILYEDQTSNINEVAVIDPIQVKSAIGNKGSFDPSNQNILFSRQGMKDPGPNQPKINSRYREMMAIRAFFDSVPDVLRKRAKGLSELGDKVEMFFDSMRKREGEGYGMLFEPLRAIERHANSEEVYDLFRRYQAAKENGRTQVAKNILGTSGKTGQLLRDLVEAWDKFADYSGTQNQKAGVEVYDPKIKAWRKIGKSKGYWPRTLNQETQDAMRDPYANADTLARWNQMSDELIAEGHIESRDEMGQFLNSYFNDRNTNDYFAALEKARMRPLPESFYEYGIEAGIGYIESWARRLSQIEQFGQKKGMGGQDEFDRVIASTTDERTREYVKAAAARIYNETDTGMMIRAVQRANMIATALQLGNPATAIVNVLGGVSFNVAAYGWLPTFKSSMSIALQMAAQNPKRAWATLTDESVADMLASDIPASKKAGLYGRQTWRAFKDLTTLPEGLWRELAEVGVLRDDFIQIHQDAMLHGLAGKGDKLLGKGVTLAMKAGGFTPFEYFNRANAAVIGKFVLTSALKNWNKKINSNKSKNALAFFQRNGFDTDKLIAENGIGEETNRWIRYASNLTNGTYQIDQTPIWIDTLAGRSIAKYQKFLVLANRMFHTQFNAPMIAALKGGESVTYTLPNGEKVTDKTGRVKPFMDTLRFFLAPALIYGLVQGPLREMLFGYVSPDPDWDEIEKVVSDDDFYAAFILLAQKAWFGILGMGALGLVGNYGQAAYDIADRQRMKNPLDPPGLAPLKGIAELGMRWGEQGTVTMRDMDEIMTQVVSQYRTGKRVGLYALNSVTENVRAAELEVAKRDISYVRKMTRRYAEEKGIEAKRRSPERIGKSELSDFKADVVDELILGNPETALMIIRAELSDTEKYPTAKDAQNALESLKDSVKARDPARVSLSPSERERRDFLQWVDGRVGDENRERVKRVVNGYRDAAVKAGGLMAVENPAKIEAEARKEEMRNQLFSGPKDRQFLLDKWLREKY